MVTRVAYPLYISQLSHTRRTEVTARVGDAIGGLALSEPIQWIQARSTRSARETQRVSRARGPDREGDTTPAAAPPNPSGPWRAGRKGLTFASDADRDRYEKGRSDGDRSGGEDRSDGVRSGVGPRGAHGEGAGLEASGHGSMDRRVSFAAQAEESGSPVRGSLKRGASRIADGAVGPHGQSLYVPPILDWRIRGWVARLLPELGAASTRPVLCLGAAPTPLAPSQRSGAVPAQYGLRPRCKGPREPRGASTSVPVRCRSPPLPRRIRGSGRQVSIPSEGGKAEVNPMSEAGLLSVAWRDSDQWDACPKVRIQIKRVALSAGAGARCPVQPCRL